MSFTDDVLAELAARFGDDLGSARAGAPLDAELLVPVRAMITGNGGDPASATWSGDQLDPWIRVDGGPIPEQGWKLHVSCRSVDIHELLGRVIPVLTLRRVTWKCAASSGALEALNQGEGGISQVGKAVTVYPRDDASAVEIAVALDLVTTDLQGPPVPSDRALRPGSRVSYRFGGFGLEHVDEDGTILDVLVDPSGALVPDRRGPRYQQPSWVEDPFLAAGVATPGPSEPRIVGDLLLGPALHRSPRGAVYLATSLRRGEPVVVKRADVGAVAGAGGVDAVRYLENEGEILAALAGVEGVPQLIDRVETVTADYLAMTPAPGGTWAGAVAIELASGRAPDAVVALARVRSLVDRLIAIHERGVIHRDLKPANLSVSDDDQVFVFDFDFAAGPSGRRLPCLGTRGAAAPTQVRGDAPTPADDVFGLGSVLYFAFSGADTAASTDPFRPSARPLTALVPGIDPKVEELISACHQMSAEARPDLVQVADTLRAVEVRQAPPLGALAQPMASDHRTDLETVVTGLLDGLAAQTRAAAAGTPVSGVDTTLYSGVAGSALVLAEAAARGRTEMSPAVELASWALDVRAHQAARTGLYHGDAGLAVATVRIAGLAGDHRLARRADAFARSLLQVDVDEVDITDGRAGEALAHLRLADLTGREEHSVRAATLARSLAAIAPTWQLGDRQGDGTEPRLLGFAHGIAGVAYALEVLGDRLDDADLCRGGRELVEAVVAERVEFTDDPLGRIGFPERAGGTAIAVLWCHGTAGIARLLMRDVTDPVRRELARRSVAGAVRGPLGSLGPTQCHGIAGTIDLALDAARCLDDDRYLAEADSLSRILLGFCIEHRGEWRCPGDEPGRAAPGYMTGQAGVAWAMLRLLDGAPSLIDPVRRDGGRRAAS